MVFDKDDIIYSYTIEQAEEDGILVSLGKINKNWKDGLFSHVTTNLLNKGYFKGKELNQANTLDLLNQAIWLVKRATDDFQKHDWFFSGEIELPNGEMQKIFIEQNETGRYTLMLPEDH